MMQEVMQVNRFDLFNYRNNKNFVEDRLEDIVRRRQKLESISVRYEEATSGTRKVNDSMAEGLTSLVDEEKELLSQYKELNDRLNELKQSVERIENTTYRNILYGLYLGEKRKTLTEISNELQYEYKYTSKLHKKALDEYDLKNVETL